MLRIPYGIADFRDIAFDKMYYVDRTSYLEVLENIGAPYILFLRPRRFGKSLWISVLQYYYGVQYKNEFQEIFGNVHIGKNPTVKANSYLILRFNFSGIATDTDEILKASFLSAVKTDVSDFIENYSTYFNQEQINSINSATDASDLMRFFFNIFRNADRKIYLLIDEYDHFTNDLLTLRLGSFKDTVTQNGWVRKFYETLKIGANEGVIGRMFITGISPITMDSLTSGFNISMNLTGNLRLHNLMGFKKDEVEEIMRGIGVENGKLAETMAIVKDWYNGYSFNGKSTDLLYNSILIAYFAVEYQNQGEIPSELLDSNIATDYGKIRNVFRIGNIEETRWEYIDKLMRNESVRIYLTNSYSFERGFSNHDFLSLLLYMGFLTIKQTYFDNSIAVKMPNRVIANLYRDYFIQIMNERAGYEHDISYLRDALFTLTAENNPRPLLDILCENLTQLSHRDFQKMDEKHIQAMFFCYVNLLQVYDTDSEYQSEKKYYDILMLKNGLAPDDLENEFLFEFKYARKATEYRLGKIDEEAIIQVNGYLTHKKIKKHPNLHVWRIVIVGSTLEICEEFL